MYSGQTRPTVEYDRKIRYLDYMENGQRSRGAGFVKLERRDGRCNISLQISGLYRKDHFTRPLLLKGDDKESELCKLQMADGGLKTYLEGLDSHNLDGRGLDYDRLTGLRIPISEGKEILCLWECRTAAGRKIEETDSETMAKRPDAESAEIERAEIESAGVERAEIKSAEIKSADIENAATGSASIGNAATGNAEVENADTAEPGEPRSLSRTDFSRLDEPEPSAANMTFKEDKWEQLCAIYPHIHPFSDEREYLALGPQDFVMLPARYYQLINNSFLLHGYYNYQHLILTRVRMRDKARYYIGVPGNLYQKEKKIAVMFGFEGFECAKEPASEGDFGYYLIPVEL